MKENKLLVMFLTIVEKLMAGHDQDIEPVVHETMIKLSNSDRDCAWCWKQFTRYHPAVKYCSGKCKDTHKNKGSRKKKNCKLCWNLFTTNRRNQVVCSPECRLRNDSIRRHVPRKTVNCKVCWELFKQVRSNHLICSPKCRKIYYSPKAVEFFSKVFWNWMDPNL